VRARDLFVSLAFPRVYYAMQKEMAYDAGAV